MESLPHNAKRSLFDGDRLSPPEPLYRQPQFAIADDGRPVYTLVDEMGCKHRLSDGCRISYARFQGYDISGVLLDHVQLDTVSFDRCDLSNTEFQRADISRVLISGCRGGPVFKHSSIREMEVTQVQDETAMLRLFDCFVTQLLISHVSCGFELSRCSGNDVRIQVSTLVGRTVIRDSQISGLIVTSCCVTNSHISKTIFLYSEIYASEFKSGRWEHVDLSFAVIRDTSFTDMRMTDVRLDATRMQSLRFREVRAAQVTAWWGEWINVQFIGGMILVALSNCLMRSLMLYGTKAGLEMTAVRAYGLRLCDVEGLVRGQETMWWRPVIRRSVLRGDSNAGILVCGADCTNSKILCDFGIWQKIDCSYGTDNDTPEDSQDES